MQTYLYKCVVKSDLSKLGMLKPYTLQRKDWPLTSSWETASEPLEYPL